MTNGSLVARNALLRSSIAMAYGVAYDNVIGPSWLDSDRYDITAKTSVADGETMPTMFQNLLADRFALRAHGDTRVVSGFDLIQRDTGIRFQNVGPKPSETPIGEFGRGDSLRIVAAKGLTMQMLARILSTRLGAPVNDKTLTSDYFVVVLEWAPRNASPDNPLPDLYQALEDKGLQLKATKVTVPTIIVDSIQRTPTEN